MNTYQYFYHLIKQGEKYLSSNTSYCQTLISNYRLFFYSLIFSSWKKKHIKIEHWNLSWSFNSNWNRSLTKTDRNKIHNEKQKNQRISQSLRDSPTKLCYKEQHSKYSTMVTRSVYRPMGLPDWFMFTH